jgi:hypothetical protein
MMHSISLERVLLSVSTLRYSGTRIHKSLICLVLLHSKDKMRQTVSTILAKALL